MNGNGASVVSRLEQLSMLQLFVDQIRLNRVALRGYLSSYGNADENDHWRLQELLDLIGVPAIIPEQGSELMQAVPEGQVDGQPVFPVLEDQFSGFAQVLLTEAGGLFHTLSYIMRAVLAINPQVNQDAVSLSIVDRYLDSIQSYLSEEGRPSSLDFKTLLLPINLKVEKKLLFY